MKKKKEFDCVEWSRSVKAQHAKEIEELGLEEWLKRMRAHLAKSSLWQRFEKKTATR
ncbi:hypothetical protein HY605_03725 [Candidatus Peregrinibacteria bacterium]|nr:hypothetical protein [Candidatus Peregrinibacteria bacterium]